MEIEVGDYVRTNKGNITKMSSEEFIKIMLENKSIFGKALKHSKNIIELVEVGDYVNGYRVDEIESWGILVHKARGINRSGFSIPIAQYENDIKSIVTHEQFANIKYKVGEE